MIRSLWNENISKTWCPPWPCPACKNGHMELVSGSLVSEETVASKKLGNHRDWDPEWIECTFTAWAECGDKKCGQKMAISGDGGFEPVQGEDGGLEWEAYYSPRACWPMPDIIVIPDKCPDDVRMRLRSAFQQFFSQPEGCAGRIRASLEHLMDHLGIKKKDRLASGKLNDISLHKRIEIFANVDPVAGGQIMALKWLGNTGSHSGEVRKEDLLDAFEILEHTLVEIVEKRSKRVSDLAKKMTKKHSR